MSYVKVLYISRKTDTVGCIVMKVKGADIWT